MAAKYIRLNEDRFSSKEISSVVEVLERGGTIIYPTDTVYGLGCDISQPKAVEKVAKLKGIKPENAKFAILLNDFSDIATYTRPFSNDIFRAMKKTLPGAFTYIMEANTNIPKIFKNKKKEIGIRIPDNNIPRELVRMLGRPIVNTSIINNDDILEYLTDPEEIYEIYKDKVDIVIDGGYGNNIPSSIVSTVGNEIEIYREGLGDVSLLS